MPDRAQTRGKLPRQLIAPLGTSGWLVELGRTFGLVAGITERAVSLMTTVLNLGGTIALTYDDDVPVTLSAAELLGESDAEMVDLDPVQSNGLSWAHLLAVRHELLSIVAAGASDVVLITGTDTVEDVGHFLHLTAPPGLRIALVCSLDTATRGQTVRTRNRGSVDVAAIRRGRRSPALRRWQRVFRPLREVLDRKPVGLRRVARHRATLARTHAEPT